MEEAFRNLGYDMVSGGTDTHLLLLDLRKKNIDGARVERVLELINIASNKNTIPSDKSALIPHGLRIGSPAMTSRGLKEKDFEKIVGFIDQAVTIAINFNATVKGTRMKDFKEALGDGSGVEQVVNLKRIVKEFSKSFPVVGFNASTMKYP
jgi:glycine hydroxymethyltransferase